MGGRIEVLKGLVGKATDVKAMPLLSPPLHPPSLLPPLVEVPRRS